MKHFNFLAIAAIATCGITAASCSDSKTNDQPEDPANYELSSDITTTRTLEAGKTYTLSGGVHVKAGATLNIPEGVTIIAKDDDMVDYILVEQGAKINARGTADKPIVMTSTRKEPGAWGGIHICGYAHTNVSGGKGVSEIGDAPYGGNNDADNSGTLSYVRVEYTGFAFSEEKESNGITFYGVGSGTTVDHCQAYKGADDGFEWFGGSVNVKYLVSTSCSDDAFDWTEGWNGKAQFMLAYQEPKATLGWDCDCLLECDNNGQNFGALPMAHPVLANLTLIGNGESRHGIRLRAGTQAEIYNAIVTGKGMPLSVETTETENALVDGISKLEFIHLSGSLSSKEGIYTNDMFVAGNGKATNQTFNLSNIYTGVISNGKAIQSDAFFTATNYIGALTPANNWIAGNWVIAK